MKWYEEHTNSGQCKANHNGAAGNMEVNAIVPMFKRSVANSGVRFRNYIGVGDSKTYTSVINAKPYGENFRSTRRSALDTFKNGWVHVFEM